MKQCGAKLAGEGAHSRAIEYHGYEANPCVAATLHLPSMLEARTGWQVSNFARLLALSLLAISSPLRARGSLLHCLGTAGGGLVDSCAWKAGKGEGSNCRILRIRLARAAGSQKPNNTTQYRRVAAVVSVVLVFMCNSRCPPVAHTFGHSPTAASVTN